MFRRFVSVIMAICFLVSVIFAQDFDMEQVKQLVETNGKLYLQPLVTAFGSAMNSGLYNTAKTHKMLGFDLGVRMNLAIVPTDQNSTYQFDVSALGTFETDFDYVDPLGNPHTYSIALEPSNIFSDMETPTILGGDAQNFPVDETYIEGAIEDQLSTQMANEGLSQDQINQALNALTPDINQYINENLKTVHSIPGLRSIDVLKDIETLVFPYPVLQAGVGLPFGLEPSIRLLPGFTLPGELGKAIGTIGVFGVGLKVDLDQFIPIPLFPVQIAAQGFLQRMKIGEILTANNVNFNIHASKSLLFLTLYGGMGVDKTKFIASYKMSDGSKQEFDIIGENKVRTTVGLRIKILVLSLNAEYNISEYNSLGIGLGLALR